MNKQTSPPKRATYARLIVLVAVFAVLVALIGSSTMRAVETRVRARFLTSVSSILKNSENSLQLWMRQQQDMVERVAAYPDVRTATKNILSSPRNPEALQTAPASKGLRAFFDGLIERPAELGFVIIAPDRVTVASSQNDNIGTRNFLANVRGPILDRVFAGETLLMPPVRSDLPPNAPTMFIATPVRDDNKAVVAVLALRLDPAEFSTIVELGQFLKTGKTYAFDSDGVLVTNIAGQAKMLELRITEPGGNELTTMARSATSGDSGSNIGGYSNHRGTEVMGAWVWDDKLNIGLATEVDSDDALIPFYEGRNAVARLLLLTFIVALIAFVTYLQVVRSRRAVDAAEEASRMKSRFLANMSHEIRTPMNGVIGLTELVLSGNLSRELRETMETIRSSAESLMGILNDILDTSKLESGQFELESVPFDLHSVLVSTMRAATRTAEMRKNELALDIAPDVPQVVIGDSLRVRQIMVNLVGNATKFTEGGEIEVSVKQQGTVNGVPAMRFSVRDTGIGIPDDKLGTIFEEFSQVDASVTRKYGGTGLGLTISYRLVELMGGRLTVESIKGKGSTFSFTIPLPAGTGEPAPVSTVALEGRSALVVDDNATNRRIARSIVEQLGMKAAEASNTDEAIRLLARGFENRPFDIGLIDIQMPGKSGFDLLTELKSLPRIPTALIVLTSSGGYGDAERARALGVRAFLTKPVARQELQERISEILAGTAAAPIKEAPLRSTSHAQRFLHLLVAEDNAVNQRVARAMLERLGHTVEIVEDGRAAVEAVQKTAFDAVLMDIEMPQLDGYAACECIRQIPRLKDLPIIGLTAHAMAEARDKAMAVGMNGFVTKPFKTADLETALQGIGTPAVRDAATKQPGPVVESHLPSVDMDGLRQEWRAAGIIAKMDDIVETFLEETAQEFSLLEIALEKKDLRSVASIAHKMKSGVAALHVHRLAKILQTIEAIAAGRTPGTENLNSLAKDAVREWDVVREIFEDSRGA
jgi:signal transduction histidine kinase/DNA-binding response OmpR family regulator